MKNTKQEECEPTQDEAEEPVAAVHWQESDDTIHIMIQGLWYDISQCIAIS